MDNFIYEGPYGTYEGCSFMTGYYENNNLAIEIWSNTEGPITRVTVNPDIKIPRDRIAIKNYSENEGMVAWLISQNLIEPDPVQIIESGFVEIPVHALTEYGVEVFAD